MARRFQLRLAWLFLIASSIARAAITIDARTPPPSPHPLPFETGGQSPDGRTLAINNRYLLFDGRPWFPVMGEFQYSRYVPEDWQRELLKMKAGGVSIVSTYVFWIHHEEIEGRFDWSGRRDLRRFIELAGRAGLLVWVRVGPWDHGEVRNGGLPDWILRKTKPRSNDAVYLRYVDRFYRQIGAQLTGLFWKEGGPIAGIQIENEYHDRGAGKGEAHIVKLKQIAKAAGLDAPFYTVTGWDDAAVPDREVIPVYSGYPDGFWYRSRTALPPSPNYFFTPIRCEENVDDNLCSRRPDMDTKYAAYPYLTAEMGGGMASSYHRRPVISAGDIAAMTIAKLGAGVTLYGYYMFHGGTNPEGKRTSLNETQATHYWNDLPLKGYDFQAPLGEFGQMHPSFRVLKSIHLFLQQYGAGLALMAAYFPAQLPTRKLDVETPRVAARSDSHSAYIFLNNYQKDHPLPNHPDFQVSIQLAERSVTVPRRTIDLPAGAYTFWPVETDLGGASLEYATAQPLTQLADPDAAVFVANSGIDPEFAFHDAPGLSIESAGAHITRENGRIYVSCMATGLTPAFRIRSATHSTQVLIVTPEQAGNIWKASLAGRDRLVYTAADAWFDHSTVHLAGNDHQGLAFGIYPALSETPAGFTHAGGNGIFDCYQVPIAPVSPKATARQTAQAGKVRPARIAQEVALVPPESEFTKAAHWSIDVPKTDAILRIEYFGDIARLYANGKLITDEFFHNAPWNIGLKNLDATHLDLAILPLRADAPIYIGANFRNPLRPGAQSARLISVSLVPQYQAAATLADSQK